MLLRVLNMCFQDIYQDISIEKGLGFYNVFFRIKDCSNKNNVVQ